MHIAIFMLSAIAHAEDPSQNAALDPCTYWNQQQMLAPPVPDPLADHDVLLLHFHGADGTATFTDTTGKHTTITPVGHPAISTKQSKFCGSSLYLDGNSYLTLPMSDDFDFSKEDGTMEAWIYSEHDVKTHCDPTPPYGRGCQEGIFSFSAAPEDKLFWWGLSYGGGAVTGLPEAILGGQHNGSSTGVGGGKVTPKEWTHVAVSKSGGKTLVFADGKQVGSGEDIFSPETGGPNHPGGSDPKDPKDGGSAKLLYIGAFDTGKFGNNFLFQGYIDEVRITKGVARYTKDFTPPAAAFGK